MIRLTARAEAVLFRAGGTIPRRPLHAGAIGRIRREIWYSTVSDLDYMTASDLAARMRSGELKAADVTEASLARIEALDGDLHAFTFVDAEGARAAASQADAARAAGRELGPLHGVPVAVKDQLAVRGMPNERGSRLHEGEVPDADVPAITKLRAAGAVILGKTAMPEYGHLAFTHSQLAPATRNPWNRAHTCGGSSGGSSVAVATGMAPIALGTDGGGSVRIPASCCGLVGLKPSLGRVAHTPTPAGLDGISHLGPIARNVADAALLMHVIAGSDQHDWATLPSEDLDYREVVRAPVAGARVGWAPRLGQTPVEASVLETCEAAVGYFRAAGCEVETVAPFLSNWVKPWEVLFEGMFGYALGDRIDEVRRVSDASFIPIVETGVRRSAAEYVRAAVARRAAWAEFAPLFERFDVILTPALTAPPLPVDADTGLPGEMDAWRAAWFHHAFPLNMTGQPGMSVPAGQNESGLPIGLQIIGPRHADARVLQFGAAYEAANPDFGARPPVDGS